MHVHSSTYAALTQCAPCAPSCELSEPLCRVVGFGVEEKKETHRDAEWTGESWLAVSVSVCVTKDLSSALDYIDHVLFRPKKTSGASISEEKEKRNSIVLDDEVEDNIADYFPAAASSSVLEEDAASHPQPAAALPSALSADHSPVGDEDSAVEPASSVEHEIVL
jgi:hypothetical protein